MRDRVVYFGNRDHVLFALNRLTGESLGQLKFPTDPSYYWRQNVLAPFLARYLKDGPGAFAPVIAYVSGINEWDRVSTWPPKAASPRHLYLSFPLHTS